MSIRASKHQGMTQSSPLENNGSHEASVAISPIASDSTVSSLVPVGRQDIEVQAEHLINEIFGDVEQLLTGASEMAVQSAQLRVISTALALRDSSSIPPRSDFDIEQPGYLRLVGEAERLTPPETRPAWLRPSFRNLNVLPAATGGAAAAELQNLKRHKIRDGLLLGAGGMSLLVGIGVWAAVHTGWLPLSNSMLTTAQLTNPNPDPFFDYLLRALKRLDSTVSSDGASFSASQQAALSALPSLPTAVTSNSATRTLQSAPAAVNPFNGAIAPLSTAPVVLPSFSGQSIAVSTSQERLPQLPVPTLPPMGDMVPPPPPFPEQPQTTNSVAPIPKPSPAPSKPVISVAKSNRVPDKVIVSALPTVAPSGLPTVIPSDPSLPASLPSLPLPTTDRADPLTVTALPSNPAAQHTLTGVMTMADQSVALVETDGITRRVQIGESIGSEWKLVSVGNQEVVLERDQQSYAVQIGQKF
jgi:hypothetical protein